MRHPFTGDAETGGGREWMITKDTRRSGRYNGVFFREPSRNMIRTLIFRLPLAIFLLVLTAVVVRAEEAPPSEPIECKPGQTMNCILLGIQAEKAKDMDTALLYYREACQSHLKGLRACTPLLSISQQMGVLDRETAFLEEKCETEGPVMCYYLGKEYLKIRQTERAIRHLEPLCRNGFKPPGKRDYGPCFHLARSFHAAKDYEKARTFYQIDCGDNIERVHPSCESLRNINLVYALAPERVVPPSPMAGLNVPEAAFFLVCVVPLAGVAIWFFGRPRGLWFLQWGGLVLFTGGTIAWIFFLNRKPVQSVDAILLFFCFFTLAGLSLASRRGNVPPENKE